MKNEEQSFYDLIFNECNLNVVATSYLNNKMKYLEFKKRVDLAARSFKKLGVKPGAIVLLALRMCPEVAINLVALNKIGAISKWVDYQSDLEVFVDYVNLYNTKILVVDKELESVLEKFNTYTNIDKIITVCKTDSLCGVKRIGIDLMNCFVTNSDNDLFIDYNRFLKIGEQVVFDDIIINNTDPAVMFQIIKNNKYDSLVYQNKAFKALLNQGIDLQFKEGESILSWMAPYRASALSLGVFLPLACNMKIVMGCDNNDLINNHINDVDHILADSIKYRYFLKDNYLVKKYDNVKTKVFYLNGDFMSVGEFEEFKDIVNQNLINIFTDDESLGMITKTSNSDLDYGTVGKKCSGFKIKIVDIDSGKELLHGETGEIYFKSKTAYLGYMSEEVDLNKDKCEWIRSGTAGRIDSNGNLVLKGEVRELVRGMSPYMLEDLTTKVNGVKDSIVLEIKDKIVIFYTIKPKHYSHADEIEEIIKGVISDKVSVTNLDIEYICIDSFPIDKYKEFDLVKLREIAEDLVESVKKLTKK